MSYTKTDKTYTYKNKTYIIYKGGDKGTTHYIRYNRKFTPVKSMKNRNIYMNGGGQFYAVLWRHYPAKQAFKAFYNKMRETDKTFTFNYCKIVNGRVGNPCKTKGIPLFIKWLPDLEKILRTYNMGPEFNDKLMINFAKEDDFWEDLQAIIPYV